MNIITHFDICVAGYDAVQPSNEMAGANVGRAPKYRQLIFACLDSGLPHIWDIFFPEHFKSTINTKFLILWLLFRFFFCCLFLFTTKIHEGG